MVGRNSRDIVRRMGFIFVLIFSVVAVCPAAFATGEGPDEEGARAESIQNSLSMKRAKSPGVAIKESMAALRPQPTLPAGRTLIREINVTGFTLLAQESVDRIKLQYENRELSGREMQRCVDLITRAYNRKGYLTSYAFIVPDRIAQGILDISVVEGKAGTIEIKGNKYFSTAILRKKISQKEGEPFDFAQLNKDLFKMNKSVDRKASLELEPSADGKIVNIIITVKDKLPVHVTFQVDNYGSEFILMQRYKTFFTYNNLTGHDDSLTAKVQLAQADAQRLFDLDYFLPINNTWKWELYYMPYKLEDYYYSDNEQTGFEKHARKWYTYLYQSIIDRPDCELVANYGFVYKDIHWYQRGVRQAMDRFRALLWGFDFNRADKYGRWVISNDLEIGIPGFWGASPRETDFTSVAGAGSGYRKNHLVVARRQKLFAGIDFLAKGHWQLSSQTLTGVNVFSTGGFMGVIDMRGYPRAQRPGDEGRSLNLGFSFPAYFVPKSVRVPFSKAKLYDSLKLFTFWDWAQAILKSPPATGEAITTLQSAGCGFTFNLPENFAVRVDFGWPLSHEPPNDGSDFHTWWSVTKGF